MLTKTPPPIMNPSNEMNITRKNDILEDSQ